jgi:exodeoxyribonuclease VII large subunit
MRLDGLSNQLVALQRTALFLEPRRILQEKQQTLDRLLEDLQSLAESAPHQLRLLLERQARILAGHRPDLKISDLSRRLSTYRDTLERRTDSQLQHEKSTLARNAAVLRALNPSAALARGYTITMDENGQILRSAKDAMKSKELTTRFHDGEVKSQVRKT